MKKKIISLAAAACMLLANGSLMPYSTLQESVSITAGAVMKDGTEGKCGANVRWSLVKGVLTISGTGPMYNYETYPDSPFAQRKDIKKIVINSGVTTIGKCAFAEITCIESVSLPSTLTEIGDEAFRWCRNLKAMTLPGSIRTIGSHAFGMCSELVSINLPEGLSVIKDHAFSYTSMPTLKLPSTLKQIGDYAFNYCSEIKGTITIPGSVKTIGKSAFCDCLAIDKVVLEEGVTTISGGAFNNCKNMTSIKLPSTLKTIDGGAFADTRALKSITIPNKVTTLGNGVFRDSAIQSLTLPNSVTSIGYSLCTDCRSLKTVTLSENMTAISAEAFSRCTALTSIKFPLKLQTIGDMAFDGCKKLQDVALGYNVSSIGKGAFRDCQSIRSLYIPYAVQTLEMDLCSGCTSLKYVHLPFEMTSIESQAFLGCRKLEYINISEGTKTIGQNAFANCTSLNSVLLPQSLKAIHEDAFINCTSLKELQIPVNVTNLGEHSIGYNYSAKNKYEKNSSFFISCVKNSSAQSYAKEYGFAYDLVPAGTVRLAGSDRYKTAVEISRSMNAINSMVVLASGLDYADALAGVPFASRMSTSVLLTDKNTVPQEVLNELERYRAKRIYILGGKGAVSENVENTLLKAGYKIERIQGNNRYETATAIAKKTNNSPSELFLVCSSGFADALSVSSVAAIKRAPIIYINKDGEIDPATAAYLKSVKGKIKNAYVIGGTGVISDEIMKKAAKALGLTEGKTIVRIAGADRYETCLEVNKKFSSIYFSTGICIATGSNYPDALAGGVYSAWRYLPVMLASGGISKEQSAYLKSKKLTDYIVFGGRGVVSSALVNEIDTKAHKT